MGADFVVFISLFTEAKNIFYSYTYILVRVCIYTHIFIYIHIYVLKTNKVAFLQ